MSALNNWFQGIDLSKIIEWLMFAAAALVSISVHESSHALSACWLGDDTAKRMGRISLNPLRHLDPLGFLMMVVAHFGWAKPVPVNAYRMTKVKSPKTGMALTALAGPVSNLLLAFVFGCLYFICAYAGGMKLWMMLDGYTAGSGLHYWLTIFLERFLILNVGLAVFNLIPISPLDGSKILAIILPDESYEKLMRYERYGMLVLIALLYLGWLDVPLQFLMKGVLNGIQAVAVPLAKLVTGVRG